MDPITIQFPIVLPAAADGEETATNANNNVIEEIMSWVPAKSVIYWKSVCKDWQSMLDNPVFAEIHFSRATLCPLLISGGAAVSRHCRIMHLVEDLSVSDLDPRSRVSKVISRFDIRTRADREQTKLKDIFFGPNTNATSCEGLLCWTAFDDNRDHYIIIISNPITREYVSLSSPQDKDKIYAFVGMGFRRETKKFELLRMAAIAEDDDDDVDEEDPLWWPEVRGVGDSSWRRVDGGYMSRYFRISQVVYVDGSIYWSYERDVVIYCFNFDRAMFQVVASMNSSKVGRLGVLDGALCLSQVCPGNGHIEVFVLVDVAAASALQWEKLYDVYTMTTHLDHVGDLTPRGQYKIIKRLSRGKILMHFLRGNFTIYDPETKEERYVCLLEEARLARNDGLDDDLQVVSHVPCLVGLKEALNMDGLQVQVWML